MRRDGGGRGRARAMLWWVAEGGRRPVCAGGQERCCGPALETGRRARRWVGANPRARTRPTPARLPLVLVAHVTVGSRATSAALALPLRLHRASAARRRTVSALLEVVVSLPGSSKYGVSSVQITSGSGFLEARAARASGKQRQSARSADSWRSSVLTAPSAQRHQPNSNPACFMLDGAGGVVRAQIGAVVSRAGRLRTGCAAGSS
ncbi:hypothetical protein BDY21DRAFT_32062 [Lineolata rhizophorae]|uniref:Uncharacterized protein n=1 Tax=Lineolata rhizophorae TaxID=578093 RepID=A0A6A6NZ97_9PEZI|nr:hypothetical protein BDY21DRAFT_32062 [Lineolata rhizophorae]